MDWALVMWLWALLYVQYHSHGCLGYLDNERTSLLEIKASINYPNGSSLPTWEDGTDCCSWERIKCNNATGRVTKISLNRTREWKLGEWYLNADLLLSFGELQSLDLSRNNLAGWVDDEGFERRSRLPNLELLDLSGNSFNESIFLYLGSLSSLRTLDLSSNNIEGHFPSEGFNRLSRLSKLEHLDLSYNSFNETILPYLGALSSLKSLSLSNYHFELLHRGVDVEYSPPIILYTSFEMLSRLGNLEELDLSQNQLNRRIIPYLGALSSLKSLDLSGNNLEGCFPSKELANLSKLEVLDLEANRLIGSLWLQVGPRKMLTVGVQSPLFAAGNLNKLEVLDLSHNLLDGFQSLQGNLNKLEVLDLSHNLLDGFQSLQGNLNKLEVLDLSHNLLDGFQSLQGNLSKLEVLDLSFNLLDGFQILQALCNLENLQELHLQSNELEGSLPPCLSNLSSLQLLDLSHNKLSGISSSLISSLTMLRFLSLSSNRFEGSLSFSSFANLSKLEVVILSVLDDSYPVADATTYPNQLEVETESTHWVPKFQLKVLQLSNCNINKLTGTIPTFLSSQHNLISLDLSHNNMKGKFPSWLLENNERLQTLDLGSNSLTGPFHLSPHPNLDTLSLDVSNNNIYGQLPESIGFLLPNLKYLNMSTNALHGTIPSSMGNMMQLNSLDLSGNKFSGGIPEELPMGCISLKTLKLSNNILQGLVLPTQSNLTELQYLYLDGNRFTGKISAGLFKSQNLQILDVGKNNLSGRLPIQIGNFTELKLLSMSENHFEGSIPVEYCNLQSLSLLDLSQNRIIGSIPSCFNLSLRFLHLEGNELTGLMPNASSKISSLVTMDVRQNNISGNIPNWIGAFPNLRVLLLGGNNFQGHIPLRLCQVKNISILDLSHNNLSGPIPPCFGNMTFGRAGEIDFSTFVVSPGVGVSSEMDLPGYRIAVSVPVSVANVSPDKEEVEFITKWRSETYKGDVLYFMAGVDLSWNQLTGEIPPEIGHLTAIHALNLSHNQLTGPVPETFSNLKQIESLDLSYNRLSGEIPPQLTELNFLSTFTVAHNNLSGRTPDRKAQFGTFGETSYEGNPHLCGPPLKSCFSTSPLPPSMPKEEEDNYDIIFYACFWASCTISFLVFIALLYINRYWRGLYFYMVDACIYSCYYFALNSYYLALDNLRKVFPWLPA